MSRLTLRKMPRRSRADSMRVGLLAAELGGANGWSTYSLNLIRQLRAAGIAATVIAARNSLDVDFDIHPLLPTVSPPERLTLFKSMRQTFAVRRLLRNCDVIHAAIEPFAVLAAAAAGRRPLFVTAHGSYVNLPRMRRFPVGQFYKAAFMRSRLICVSRHTAAVARQQMPDVRATVINNGVDAARFLDPPPLRVDKKAPTVIAIGEIKPRKGTLQLVTAMARVRQQIPQAQCLIMGHPQYGSAYTARVQETIDRLDLQDNVHLLGRVDDSLMRAWLAAADALALPAMNDGWWFEGFGLTVYEAGAAGTAVVGTDGCGVADAIEHGVSGLIVSQDNVAEELPRALTALLSDPARAAQMGAAGRRRAQRQSWEAAAQQVIRLYQQALR